MKKIKKKISRKIENAKSRRIEKRLIKSDDETVVQVLTQDEDNSNLDIQKIVSNMNDPQNMVEVVESNLGEIIEQDNVRDTLKFLPDENITKIMEENKEQLKEQDKIANAILPIKNNKKKLEYLDENLSFLTDLEVQKILRSLKPERNRKDSSETEKTKIQIIGKKIFEDIKKYGSAFHMLELTETLSDEAKKDLFYSCLKVFANNEENPKLPPKSKLRFVERYSSLVDLDFSQYLDEGLLTQEEVSFIETEKERKQIKKDEKNEKRKGGTGR